MQMFGIFMIEIKNKRDQPTHIVTKSYSVLEIIALCNDGRTCKTGSMTGVALFLNVYSEGLVYEKHQGMQEMAESAPVVNSTYISDMLL